MTRNARGPSVETHTHSQDEDRYVISGEVEVGGHVVRAGDMHVALAGSRHERVRSRTGALLLLRLEIPDAATGFA